MSTSAAKMVTKGLKVLIGAHGEPPKGLNYHAELAFAKEGGLTNYQVSHPPRIIASSTDDVGLQVLKAATVWAAETLDINSSVGTLTPGKLADLLIYPPGVDLLDGDISETRKLKHVMRGGRLWEADTMNEIWPVRKKAQTMPRFNPS